MICLGKGVELSLEISILPLLVLEDGFGDMGVAFIGKGRVGFFAF